jgi:hypothetical protein
MFQKAGRYLCVLSVLDLWFGKLVRIGVVREVNTEFQVPNDVL